MINKKRGFTLIEVLIVMGIMAVLATIVIVAINPGRQFAQARNMQRVSNVNAILNAIGQNIADNKGVTSAEITTTEEDISSVEANILWASLKEDKNDYKLICSKIKEWVLEQKKHV